MSRPTQWYRNNAYYEWDGAPGPWVQQMASFGPGETLMRTRLEMQMVGTASVDDQQFPTAWQGVDQVIALLWDQAEGDYPPDPPGYFDTALYPWIWVQQVCFQTDNLYVPVAPLATTATWTNTTPSQSIDCHSARLTDPGNYSRLWLVMDYQATNPLWAESYFPLSVNATWSVMSKLPAS